MECLPSACLGPLGTCTCNCVGYLPLPSSRNLTLGSGEDSPTREAPVQFRLPSPSCSCSCSLRRWRLALPSLSFRFPCGPPSTCSGNAQCCSSVWQCQSYNGAHREMPLEVDVPTLPDLPI